jgi:hypothetical protein
MNSIKSVIFNIKNNNPNENVKIYMIIIILLFILFYNILVKPKF